MTFWNYKSDHKLLEEIAHGVSRLVELLEPRLTSIALQFITEDVMSAAAVTLNIGQTTQATVVGFDQFGNPFTPVPQPNYSIDQPSVASIAQDATNPAAEDITALSVGTANLTAGVTTAQGTALTATGVVTVQTSVAPPVLSSIAIQFSSPVTPTAQAAAKTEVKRS